MRLLLIGDRAAGVKRHRLPGGTFGHEAEHKAMSEHPYGLSWRRHVAGQPERRLATGYSCRSQVKRFDDRVLRHPARALLAATRERGRTAGGDAIQAPT